MRARSVVLAAFVGMAAFPVGFAPSAAASPAAVYLIQGVEGATWSLTVDDEEVAADASDKEIVGPLELMPGTHTVTASGAGGLEITADLSVEAGVSMDVVLHRPVDPTADPMFTSFTNDLSPVKAGSGRLSVAHTAVAPPADIRVDGEVLLADVASAEEITTTVPAGVYLVDVVPAATDGPTVLGPVDLPVAGGKLTRVFAIGVASERTMDAVVQVLRVPVLDATTPRDVPAGDGGQGERLFGVPVGSAHPVGLVLLVAGMALAAAGLRILRPRG
ncbi:MAG: DUF4397 domain-containing protein [Nocardioides sp.]